MMACSCVAVDSMQGSGCAAFSWLSCCHLQPNSTSFVTDHASGQHKPAPGLIATTFVRHEQRLLMHQLMLTTVSAMPILPQVHNPFVFKHVEVLGGGKQFHDTDPCVMLATPSMLQSGFSRDLFEAWAGDRNNTVLIVDFAVQGTLARQLLDSPQTVTTRDNRPVSKVLGGTQPLHAVPAGMEYSKLLRHVYCLLIGSAQCKPKVAVLCNSLVTISGVQLLTRTYVVCVMCAAGSSLQGGGAVLQRSC